MSNKILVFLLSIVFFQLNAQSWKEIDDNKLTARNNVEREIIPLSYKVFSTDILDVKGLLSDVTEAGRENESKRKEFAVPMPDGTVSTFSIYEAPVMKSGLSAKYPNIKSYKGFNDKGDIMRFDVSPYGFRASILNSKGEIYIDPYIKGELDNYIVYYTKDFAGYLDESSMVCGVSNEEMVETKKDLNKNRNVAVDIYEYDVAIACTGQWGAKRGTVEKALADINTSVVRLNQIFENQLAYRIILIEENDKLVFIDGATDPYSEAIYRTGGSLIPVNTNIINAQLGHSNYDFGHIYTVGCTDVGGVAFLASVCNPPLKAGGCTCFANNNILPTTVSIVSHEMGHQFNASHTFNNCGGNESNTGVEPGSGGTIMSYAGLCGQNNVQSDNYDFYHSVSLEQIEGHTRFGGATGCATTYPTGNVSPVITLDYEDDFFIPAHTSFYLVGSATDANEDAMTYNWEQMDVGPISTLGDPQGNSPLFRIYYPTENDFRIFPQRNAILNNQTTSTEVLPRSSRNLSFNFVVRDNNPEGGYAEWELVKFKSFDTGEAFAVTFPNEVETFKTGQKIEVTWNVAGTDASPINTEFVDIYLSDNGAMVPEREGEGLTLLSCGTPNDGSETIELPNVRTAKGRILIKAQNNIYFDISDRDFEVEEPTEPNYYVSSICDKIDVCLPNEAKYTFETASYFDFDGNISFEVIDLPASVQASFAPATIAPGESTELTLSLDQTDLINDYVFNVQIIAEGGDTNYREIKLRTIGTDFSDFGVSSPSIDAVGVSTSPKFEWIPSINATEYRIQISDSPLFDLTNGAKFLIDETTIKTNFTVPDPLEKSSVFYYRVAPINNCREGDFSDIRAFSTVVQACGDAVASSVPKNISGSGAPTVDVSILITDDVPLDDVNVTVRGTHQNLKDLEISLISPLGTKAVLVSNQCPANSVFNVTFDDEAALPVLCNFNDGSTYRPKEALSKFVGESIQGQWIVRIADKVPGNGGKIEYASVEICSSVALNAPLLIKNNPMQLSFGQTVIVNSDFLLVEDADNIADDLEYTVIKGPIKGYIYLGSKEMFVGDTFTQADINNGLVKYWTNTSELDTEDSFNFTVVDGNGGFIPTTSFVFQITNVSSTEDIFGDDLLMYPNPASDAVYFEVINDNLNYTLKLLSTSGKEVYNTEFKKSTNINLMNFQNGVYIVDIRNENSQFIKKLIINK